MQLDSLIQNMTPQIYERIKSAVETGKWPDGTVLSEEQRDSAMQAVMMYQSKVLESDEHMTINADGEIVHKSREEIKQSFRKDADIARFKQDDF